MPEPVATQLKRWREGSGLSVRKAARAAGLKPSTYQHYEDPDRFKGPHLPLELAQALSKAAASLQIDPGPVLALAGLDEERWAQLHSLTDLEVIRYDTTAPSKEISEALAALIGGTASRVPWLIRGRALLLAGYLQNDIVIVDHDKDEAALGNVVIVNIHDVLSNNVRTIIRICEPPYLVSASADISYRKPIIVDQNHVKIVGTVISLLRIL